MFIGVDALALTFRWFTEACRFRLDLGKIKRGDFMMQWAASTVGALLIGTLALGGEQLVGQKLEKLWSDGEFTEGPALGPDWCIYFSDIGNRIMKFDPETKKTTEFRNPSGRANGL